MFYYSLLNSIKYDYNMTMTCTPLLPVWWNMSPWPTSKALSGRSPRHRKHQFQFQFSSGSPSCIPGIPMDFPSGLAKEWQTFCQMQQMSKNVLQFLSCMFLLSSGCFKCQHPSELKWKSKAMILILQAKEPKHGPDAFS